MTKVPTEVYEALRDAGNGYALLALDYQNAGTPEARRKIPAAEKMAAQCFAALAMIEIA